MNTLLEQAWARMQTLPAAMQDQAARMLLTYAGDDAPRIDLSPEEEKDLQDAQDEMTRGEFASDAELQAVFDKYRL